MGNYANSQYQLLALAATAERAMTIPQELIDRARAVPIEDIAPIAGLRRQGNGLVSPCPWCGKGKDRFWINKPKNIWGNRCGCHPVDGADGIEFVKLRFK